MPRGDFSFNVFSVDCASSEPSRLQGRDDILHPVMGKPAIDARLHRSDGPCGLAGGEAIDQQLDFVRRRSRGRNLVSDSRNAAKFA